MSTLGLFNIKWLALEEMDHLSRVSNVKGDRLNSPE